MDFRTNLQPWDLIPRALASSRADFVDSTDQLKLLAVRVGEGKHEVERALMEIAGEATVPWQARLATTGIGTVVAPISEGFLAAAAAAQARREAAPQVVRRILSQGAFFLAPLVKRRDLSAERLTIGRSNSNDIVLRDRSVSVQHAWIECDDRSLLYLSDDGSTNGTQLNGRSLEPGELEPIQAADVIRFGDVESILVEPGTLWDLLWKRDDVGP